MSIAIVTGASSGFGKAFVKQMSQYYPNLTEIWIIARRKERLEELASEVNIPTTIFCLDITKRESLDVLAQKLSLQNPEVELLINNAGFGKIGFMEHIALEDQDGMIALNCQSLVDMTYMVLPYMIKGSHIIQLASAAAFLPQPKFAVYAASKAFVLHFSLAIYKELKSRKIFVTTVCPGPADTEFFTIAEQTGKIATYKKLLTARHEKVVQKALKDSKKKRSLSVYGFSMKVFHIASKILPYRFCMWFIK